MKTADHVIVRGQVFRAEEKAPFVPSGESIQGLLEYDRETDRIKCHECGKWFASIGGHAQTHGLSPREYKLKYGLNLSSGLLSAGLRASAQKTSREMIGLRVGLNVRGKSARKPKQAGKRVAGNRLRYEWRNANGLCREQLLERLKVIAKDLGYTPTQSSLGHEFRAGSDAHFGGWDEMCKAAGLPASHKGGKKLYETKVLCELLVDFYVLNQRLPRARDFSTGSLPSFDVYLNRFASLANAYEAAGLVRVAESRRVA